MTLTQNTSILRAKLAQENAALEKLKKSLAIGVFSGSRSSVEAKIESCKEAIRDITSQLEIATRQIHKVYHVELVEPFEGKKHFYFGSQAAIYETFTSERIGITLDWLRHNKDLSEAPYTNKKCTIRLGEVRRKHTLRGKKI